MAVLNIKNLPDELYEKLKARAKEQRRSVAQEVQKILADTLDAEPRPSILELRGLGKELWEGIDPAEYIEQERSSWD
ncbi:MAG: Arc family DNA-binding protein [Gemmatirosa sp.]|nr:Arc family DNA-binding protein [Gemmatirosa sp.]